MSELSSMLGDLESSVRRLPAYLDNSDGLRGALVSMTMEWGVHAMQEVEQAGAAACV